MNAVYEWLGLCWDLLGYDKKGYSMQKLASDMAFLQFVNRPEAEKVARIEQMVVSPLRNELTEAVLAGKDMGKKIRLLTLSVNLSSLAEKF